MNWVVLMVMILFLPCLNLISQAQQVQEEVVVETKQVQGEVSSLTPRGKPEYIGITYKEDNEKGTGYEIILFMDKDIKLVNKNELSEIGIGDTVDVTFEEITTTTQDGGSQNRRVAKSIRFIRKADEATLRKYGLIRDKESMGQ